jgi:hypothetical protein
VAGALELVGHVIEARPPLARHAPDDVHGVLGLLGDAEPAQSVPSTPMVSATPAAPDRADVAPDLVPDDRELRQCGVQDPALEPRPPRQHEAEHRHQHQQQREQREEAAVGEQPREVACLVVAELPHHGEGHGERAVAPLEAVEPVHAPPRAAEGSPHRRRHALPPFGPLAHRLRLAEPAFRTAYPLQPAGTRPCGMMPASRPPRANPALRPSRSHRGTALSWPTPRPC